MLNTPMDVLHNFEVRKSKHQKQAFRDAVQAYAEGLGYKVTVEKGSLGVHNVVIGNPATAEYLVTAHYDTPARMIVPNLLTPCNLLTFILYQLFVTVIMFIPPTLIGVLVNLLTDNRNAAYLIWYALLWVDIILMMAGPANPHTANDNTSGVVTLLEIARTMPENQRSKVAFVLFDLEELGLIGSSAYRKAHKAETQKQIILNLDCVGDGNEIVFFPTGKLCKDQKKLEKLCTVVSRNGKKTISVCNKGFRTYPSDQKNFPYGVGIAAFHRKKGVGLYVNRIHTAKDTVLDPTNVNVLRAALTSLVTTNH